MSSQPIKNSTNYEKFISKELRNLLENSIQDVATDIVPSTYITPEIFFAGALSTPDCMLYKVLNGYLTSIKIEELSGELFDLSMSLATIDSVRPNRPTIECSGEMKVLLRRANQERMNCGHNLITSDHLLLAILAERVKLYEAIYDIFNGESVTYEIMTDLSKKMHEAAESIATMTDDAINDENLAISMDMASEGGDSTVITIVGEIGEDGLPEEIMKQLSNVISSSVGTTPIPIDEKSHTTKKSKGVPSYCTCLNDLAEKGNLAKVVGRETEINEIIKVFNRKKCNNVILVGESGVGKTSIVESMAQRIVDGNIPSSLRHCKIYLLRSTEMMAGTQFRGVFEDRLNNLIKDLSTRKDCILFLDNIHNLFDDRKRSDYDFAGALSNIFNEPNIKIIATTTPKGYHATFDGDAEISRKFQKISVDQPTLEETIDIIRGIKDEYGKYHGVKFSEETLSACAELAKRYITDRNLPSSAIDILDEAGAMKKIKISEPIEVCELREGIVGMEKEKDKMIKSDKISESEEIEKKINDAKVKIANLLENKSDDNTVTLDDIYAAISEHTGIPIHRINVSEKQAIAKMDGILKKDIIGQDEAIDTVCRAIKRNKVGLSPENRPIFSCMCVGSTGVGKTLLAKKLAKEIFGSEKYLVRFDMSEYSDATSVNKLIGSSAGYVGYNEGGLLTEAIKNKKHAVVLIDEVEKANEQIFNLFLQILDEGCLTDNTGQKVDFKNTILILTSNIGVKRASTEKSVGFVVDENANKKDIIEKELKNKFSPEFINRLDEIVYFNSLTDENLKAIINLEIKNFQKRLKKMSMDITWNRDVVDYLFKVIEKEKEYGARPILRAIQTEIENRITDMILENDYANHQFVVKIINEKIDVKSVTHE